MARLEGVASDWLASHRNHEAPEAHVVAATANNSDMCRSSDSWGNMASPHCIARQIGIYDWPFGCTRVLNFIAVAE